MFERHLRSEQLYLAKYLSKYPDRVDLVNVIVSVYELGALEPELLAILIANTNRIKKLSGQKEAFDARPMAYGKKRKPKPVRPPSKVEQQVYTILKENGQVTMKELIAMFAVSPKSASSMISKAKKLLEPDEYVQSIDGTELLDDGVRDRTFKLMKR